MTSAPFANIAQQPMMALDKESKEDIEAWARIVNTQLGKKLKESNLPLKDLVAKSLSKDDFQFVLNQLAILCDLGVSLPLDQTAPSEIGKSSRRPPNRRL